MTRTYDLPECVCENYSSGLTDAACLVHADVGGPTQPGEVLAHNPGRSNATLILNVHRLGYIRDEDTVLDTTYGQGTFWRKYRPALLVTNDLDPATDATFHEDFRALPFEARQFDVVVFDPPYKLNGTPSGPMDDRYGVGTYTRWQDRMDLCVQGIATCAAVCSRTLLIKCMDQVVSGRVRWQSRIFADVAEGCGFRLEDMLLMPSGRPQPEGRRQVHARRNYSNLLVLERT